MNAAGLKTRLLAVLSRENIQSETVAVVADLVAADARFNLSVADKKRAGEAVDLLRLAESYELLVESCAEDLSTFEKKQDQVLLRLKLRAARDDLNRGVLELGGRRD